MSTKNYIKICVVLLLLPLSAAARTDFKLKEAMLASMMRAVASAEDSAQKTALNAELLDAFEETLRLPRAVRCEFKSVPHLYRTVSPDKRLTFITWNMPAGSAQRFFGFALLRQSRWSSKATVVRLVEMTDYPTMHRNKTLPPNQWAGALYTKILQRKANGTTYYTLLGLRLFNKRFGSKIIDVATIGAGDGISFGAPIFNERNHRQYRIVFEYNIEASIKLEWNSRLRKIVFTSMMPVIVHGNIEAFPADSFDALAWDGTEWVFEENVIIN